MKLICAVLLAVAAFAAQAQAWPTKPVRVVVAFAPGGSLDFVTRTIADRVSQDIGQPVVVENRPGANGNVAAAYVAKQPADGYIVLSSADALLSSAHLYKLEYDALKDLAPVIQFTRQPLVLAVHPSLGVNSVAELIAAAKKTPGLAYATSGAGSGQHIAGEWLAKLAGVQLTHVGYKGGGQAIIDLVGGQVKIGSLGNTPVMPHHRAGKLKIIAQSGASRAPSLSDVPTYEESGLTGLVIDQWLGLLVPAGTPREVVQRLNAAAAKALKEPAVREKLAPQGLEVVAHSVEEFERQYRGDYEKFGKLIRELQIKLN
jgi:tripartite-type tricarboxylate transporter receptor subunit TctC